MTPTERALADVAAEREHQTAKWGVQSLPDGTGTMAWARYGIPSASTARRVCDEATRAGEVKWAHVLLEEVSEALHERNPARLRAELVQVAAVAVQWVEHLDRRGK